MIVAGGCGPALDGVLEGVNGGIRLEAIEKITQSSLSEDEQRQALRDLGITDEELIDLLVRRL